MNKNLIILVLMLSAIGAGIYFAVLQDKNRDDILLVEQAINNFSQAVSPLEKQFLNNRKFQLANTKTNLPLNKTGQSIEVTTVVGVDRVTLRFSDGDTEVANKTIVLVPFIENSQVRWQCIEGSIILRLRPRDCQLGKKILLSSD
ncbi:hypothetical protein FLL45_13855 [Aliikangiella marina]|uniref:Pilin n=1 Tax=Aliikangiella marina TaxID=1712262 RepID=A0A545T9P8_9GAMM|nr:pilin [Aliikangiella marina]TQV73943.1 hypothetical protein FLL45_13855 [Aliikangiella marina]